jgi:hypothetical protein
MRTDGGLMDWVVMIQHDVAYDFYSFSSLRQTTCRRSQRSNVVCIT